MLPKGARACSFCEVTDERPGFPSRQETSKKSTNSAASDPANREQWRGELNQRLQAYRARRRKSAGTDGQTQLPFETEVPDSSGVVCATDPATEPPERLVIREEFAFTLAIGRPPKKKDEVETHLLIDVSVPPAVVNEEPPSRFASEPVDAASFPMIPSASIEERRAAAWIDIGCLAFAYGAFLLLFGSLGGHFTFSKLSATVYFFTFAFVYVQYFGLFTVFGGTTPGMMVRGLHVASFSADSPTPRQYLLRAAGYMLSAGTLFLGFFWALWDEDELTWHDRISNTYLAIPETAPDLETTHAAATH